MQTDFVSGLAIIFTEKFCLEGVNKWQKTIIAKKLKGDACVGRFNLKFMES
jgi:hypothetical protein